MNNNLLSILHVILSKLAEISTKQELEQIITLYTSQFDISDKELNDTLLTDIQNIGNALIMFRSKNNSVSTNKQLSGLTPEEMSELIETEKVIDENLFSYHFQPIVSAVDGEIYSYEALMRPQSKLCPSPYHIMKYAELSDRLSDIERATFLNILKIIDDEKEKFTGRRVFINSIPKTRLSNNDFQRYMSYLKNTPVPLS